VVAEDDLSFILLLHYLLALLVMVVLEVSEALAEVMEALAEVMEALEEVSEALDIIIISFNRTKSFVFS
jgi:hypothetical protein